MAWSTAPVSLGSTQEPDVAAVHAVRTVSAACPATPARCPRTTAGTAHAFAEVLSQAGVWGLSFELADPVAAGAYQGMGGTFYSLGATAAPFVVTGTALAGGMVGWIVLAGVFLLSAAGMTVIAVRAANAADAASTVSAPA